jgi:hypothetical protein
MPSRRRCEALPSTSGLTRSRSNSRSQPPTPTSRPRRRRRPGPASAAKVVAETKARAVSTSSDRARRRFPPAFPAFGSRPATTRATSVTRLREHGVPPLPVRSGAAPTRRPSRAPPRARRPTSRFAGSRDPSRRPPASGRGKEPEYAAYTSAGLAGRAVRRGWDELSGRDRRCDPSGLPSASATCSRVTFPCGSCRRLLRAEHARHGARGTARGGVRPGTRPARVEEIRRWGVEFALADGRSRRRPQKPRLPRTAPPTGCVGVPGGIATGGYRLGRGW